MLGSRGPVTGNGTLSATTDAEGRFAFSDVDPGDYQASARRDNFRFNEPRRPELISLKAGDAKTNLVLAVAPLGAITGHVRNEDGDPVQNLQVSLMTYEYTAFGRELRTRGSATTNDLGEYRLFGVVPGKYYIRAIPVANRQNADDQVSYAVTYYPGAIDPAAAGNVELAVGQELRGIDFSVRSARLATVRGRVIQPEGASSVQLTLTQTRDGSTSTTMPSLKDPGGAFEWRSLATGSYTVGAQASAGGARLNAKVMVQVGFNDIDNIELRLAPAAVLAGRVRVDGNAGAMPGTIAIRGSAGRVIANPVKKEDGTFEFRNLEPDTYRPAATTVGVYIKSVRCGSADVTASGIDFTAGGTCDLTVTLGSNPGKVEGRVEADPAERAASAIVTLVADGPRRGELFGAAEADAGGRFTITGLVPGAYRAYAWEEVDRNAVRYDPEFVRPFESLGVKVEVTEGGSVSIAPRLIKAQ
jgi:protocatechuate 3,4-dioxygenase beta subunit